MLKFGLLKKGTTAEPIFDGGIFANGGFENGLNGWLEYTSWAAGDNSADNPGTLVNELLYQNLTLELDATYKISATQLEGDALVNFMINDVDSGIDITTGAHTFVGDGQPRSIGIYVNTGGTYILRIDNMRLVKIADANVVMYNGEVVTHNGEEVTYNG